MSSSESAHEQLTPQEAEKMLERLAEHYREPVRPVSEYCEAIRTWFRCIEKNAESGASHGSGYAGFLRSIELDISKSSLLARMIYGGEPLRTRPCPVHKGRWSGISPCEHGCGSTGWVKEGWPECAERCTEHPDRPAVSESFGYHSDDEHLTVRRYCWPCYRNRWER